MDARNAQLWQQIKNFAIDAEGAQLTFTDRLARQNGWSRGFARRVVEEYKRFVFMAMAAGHEVTPSDEVDEAWHLHLTYTRSYWDGLCRGVLGKPLHHIPTRGGTVERARHIEQYERTLATYAACFGQSPPTDIWPAAVVRFAKDSRVRVNRNGVWIFPKPRWPRRTVGRDSLLVGALAAPFLLGATNPLDLTGPKFLLFYAIVCGVAILAGVALRYVLRTDSPMDEQELSPYEVACLGGGVPGVLRSCLASLVVDNRLKLLDDMVSPKKGTAMVYLLQAQVPPTAADHEIERIMLREASHENGAATSALLDAARPAAEEIESDLQQRGLMESNETFAAARWGPVILLSLVLLLGIAKIIVGIERNKPVLFLMLSVLVPTLVLFLYFARRPLRTRRGEERLRKLKGQYERLRRLDLSEFNPVAAPLGSSDFLLAAGLFGLGSLHHPDVDALDKSLKPLSTSSASSDCGGATGCGGGDGGCGGGCGGCGGD